MTASDKWYCSLPWTGFSNDPDGKVRPCCLYKDYIRDDNDDLMYVQTHSMEEIFHSTFMKSLRQQFRDGSRPKECSTCLIDERHGHRSKRQIYNRNKPGTDQPIVDFEKEPRIPTEFQMIISNACNLKCRSCSPSHSNLWQAEHKVIWGHTSYSMPHGQSGDKNGLLWKNRHEWMSSIENLEIVGGEPFYIKQWDEIWEEMIALGVSKTVRMSMSSNALIFAGEKVQHLGENFNHIGLGLSIDGMGETYDYLRHPGKWDEVSKNVIHYSDWKRENNIQNVDISISHTIGWLNVFWLPEFKQWLNENTQDFKFWYNTIHHPNHMALWAIPVEVKQLIANKLTTWGQDVDNVTALINYMNSKNPTDSELYDLYETFRIHDRVRNEDILKVVPIEFLPHMQHLLRP